MELWTKLWFYGQNYGTILRPMELWFTKDKNMEDYQETLTYNEKTMLIYQNNLSFWTNI